MDFHNVSLQVSSNITTVSLASSESEPHSQLESGFGSMSPHSRQTPEEESPQEASSGSAHGTRDSSIRTSAILQHPLQVSHRVITRVASGGQLNPSAADFPHTYKPPLPSEPVTFVIGAHSPPATSLPVSSPLLSTKPATESMPPPRRSFPHLQIAGLENLPEGDAALSRTFTIDDAMGYPHEHRPGQKVVEAAQSKPLSSASRRNSVSRVERTASQHSMSSPISISSSQAEINVTRQTRSSSVSSASSSASGLVMNASGSSTPRDLSAVPPEPHTLIHRLLKAVQKMKGMIASEEASTTREEECEDHDKAQYVFGLGIKM